MINALKDQFFRTFFQEFTVSSSENQQNAWITNGGTTMITFPNEDHATFNQFLEEEYPQRYLCFTQRELITNNHHPSIAYRIRELNPLCEKILAIGMIVIIGVATVILFSKGLN